jgi:hypothetical protein
MELEEGLKDQVDGYECDVEKNQTEPGEVEDEEFVLKVKTDPDEFKGEP